MPENTTELTAIAIICIFLIKEVFAYLRNRKTNGNANYKTELALVNQKLDNHINTISETLRDIKEEIREIKGDILDIKIGRK